MASVIDKALELEGNLRENCWHYRVIGIEIWLQEEETKSVAKEQEESLSTSIFTLHSCSPVGSADVDAVCKNKQLLFQSRFWRFSTSIHNSNNLQGQPRY